MEEEEKGRRYRAKAGLSESKRIRRYRKKEE